jgi:DUF1680 family protein
MDLYLLTGNATYLAAVDGFWTMFRAHWMNVGGSVAIKEWELYPPGSYYLDTTGESPHCSGCHSTGELCGSAFWIKLNQRLLAIRPDNETYAAEIERSLLNAVISQIPPDGSGIRQFALLHKVKMIASNISTCCEGQGTRIMGYVGGGGERGGQGSGGPGGGDGGSGHSFVGVCADWRLMSGATTYCLF